MLTVCACAASGATIQLRRKRLLRKKADVRRNSRVHSMIEVVLVTAKNYKGPPVLCTWRLLSGEGMWFDVDDLIFLEYFVLMWMGIHVSKIVYV